MRVALAQTDCVLGDTEVNLHRAKVVVAEVKDRSAGLTVFPELSLSGYALAAGKCPQGEGGPPRPAGKGILNRLAEEGGDL